VAGGLKRDDIPYGEVSRTVLRRGTLICNREETGESRIAMVKTSKIFILCSFLVVCLSSCSPRMYIIGEMTAISEKGAAAFENDDDLELTEKAIPGNIKYLETLLENDPGNTGLLLLLSKLYASYSFSFIDGKLEAAFLLSSGSGDEDSALVKRSTGYYLKGADYALRALKIRYSEAEESFKNPLAADIFLGGMKSDDVPALFWYGFNMGLCINLNRDSVAFISKAYIAEKIMKRVIDIDAGYHHCGAHLFLIAYYSNMPPSSEENLKLSLFHYKRLKEMEGEGFLLADLFYGRYYLWRIQAKGQYEEVMKRIIESSGRKKEHRFYNAVAAQRAGIYLRASDVLFE
jgi:hypothetical protein